MSLPPLSSPFRSLLVKRGAEHRNGYAIYRGLQYLEWITVSHFAPNPYPAKVIVILPRVGSRLFVLKADVQEILSNNQLPDELVAAFVAAQLRGEIKG